MSMEKKVTFLDQEAEDEDDAKELLPDYQGEEYKRFQEQDERWGDVVQDARRHLSHREAHAEYRRELTRAIGHYRVLESLVMDVHCKSSRRSASGFGLLNHDLLRIIAEFAFDKKHGLIVEMLDYNVLHSFVHHKNYCELQRLQQESDSPVQPFFIYLRKRPLLHYEISRHNYDVVDINTYALDIQKGNGEKSTAPFSNLVCVHDGKLARNGRILKMEHKVFAVSEAFSEHATNKQVCEATVAPLVSKVLRGSPATVLLYGQTGTGKTYTLVGALEYVASRLEGLCVELTFNEIRGKNSFDLLNDRAKVHLRADENEHVHIRGCKTAHFESLKSIEFMAVLNRALSNRSSKVTERNPISSRSHAICSISVVGKTGQKTSLRLVDLAGSERNYETSQFTAEEHRESADINFALMSLKDCFRAYNASRTNSDGGKLPQRVPYRAALLTRILRECFIRESNHTTSVIATVSPSPTDLEHTLNTLEHVTMMDPLLDRLPIHKSVSVDVMIDGCAPPNTPVDSWSNDELMAWLSHADGGKFSQLVLPANMTGKALMELNMATLTALCAGQLREAREEEEGSAWVEEGATTKGQLQIAKRLYALLRREQNASILRQCKAQQIP